MMMEAPWGLELRVKVNKQTRSQGLGLEYKELKSRLKQDFYTRARVGLQQSSPAAMILALAF
jgi:hypothetical protein